MKNTAALYGRQAVAYCFAEAQFTVKKVRFCVVLKAIERQQQLKVISTCDVLFSLFIATETFYLNFEPTLGNGISCMT